MPTFHADLAAQAVPRYTSYPTADRFTGDVSATDQEAALQAVEPGTPTSFYVHIPYCHEICWYCGCTTGAIGRADRLATYVKALDTEIDTVAQLLSGRLAALHFGGGTPNALAPGQLVGLIKRIRARFGPAPTATISVELDPRRCDRACLEALSTAGVTRISLGVQTFADGVQKAINRVQPFEQVAAVVADARAVGIAGINLDLLYGLPGQSLADVETTAALCIELAPDRVAAFGYAHLPGAIPRQRMIETAVLPNVEERFAQSVALHQRLTGAGYQAIGFDHFARPDDGLAAAARAGRLHRNFQGFTDERCDILVGLGASAISHFPGAIIQNEKHVGRYRDTVEAGGLAGVRGTRRDCETEIRWRLIERLLCKGEIDLDDAKGLMGDWATGLNALASRGVIRIERGRARVAPGQEAYARLAAACFDAQRGPDIARAFAV